MKLSYMSRRIGRITRPVAPSDILTMPRLRNCTLQEARGRSKVLDHFIDQIPSTYLRANQEKGRQLAINVGAYPLSEGDCIKPPGPRFLGPFIQAKHLGRSVQIWAPTITMIGFPGEYKPLEFCMDPVEISDRPMSREKQISAAAEAMPEDWRSREYQMGDIVEYGTHTLHQFHPAPSQCTWVTIETFFIDGNIHDVFGAEANTVETGPVVVYRPVYVVDF